MILDDDSVAPLIIQENRGSLYEKINLEKSYFDVHHSAAVLKQNTQHNASPNGSSKRQYSAEFVPIKSEFRAYLAKMDTMHSLSP